MTRSSTVTLASLVVRAFEISVNYNRVPVHNLFFEPIFDGFYRPVLRGCPCMPGTHQQWLCIVKTPLSRPREPFVAPVAPRNPSDDRTDRET